MRIQQRTRGHTTAQFLLPPNERLRYVLRGGRCIRSLGRVPSRRGRRRGLLRLVLGQRRLVRFVDAAGLLVDVKHLLRRRRVERLHLLSKWRRQCTRVILEPQGEWIGM